MMIDFSMPEREEIRFALVQHEHFLETIGGRFVSKQYSDKPYTQTIYFNNDDHDVPFGVSLKVRRYVQDPLCSLLSLTDKDYFLEVKKSSGSKRTKTRDVMTLEEAERFLNHQDSSMQNLRPYMAVVYHRRHFVPTDNTGVRVTLDDDIKYFYFLGSDAIQTGSEDEYARLEIKETDSCEASVFANDTAVAFGAVPVISKKCKGFYFATNFLTRRFGRPFYDELEDYEIEAKLDANGEESFRRAKRLFRSSSDNFLLAQHFPYTCETHGIQRYYAKDDKTFRASFVGAGIKITGKWGETVIKDPFNLGCILKRRETKGSVIPADSHVLASAEFIGCIDRSRKAFYVTNQATGRFYHISVDDTSGSSSHISQLEIEYVGKFGTNPIEDPESEGHIVYDIATITRAILSNDPSLRPTTLTKKDFLLGRA